jgi:hypothetical protein
MRKVSWQENGEWPHGPTLGNNVAQSPKLKANNRSVGTLLTAKRPVRKGHVIAQAAGVPLRMDVFVPVPNSPVWVRNDSRSFSIDLTR